MVLALSLSYDLGAQHEILLCEAFSANILFAGREVEELKKRVHEYIIGGGSAI